MEIDADLVDRVRRHDRAAVESVFTELFPAVHRMAYALTGRADAGSAVERFVLKRAMRVLATRRARFKPRELKEDVLLSATPPDPAFAAFVRAIRSLPMQPREAFLLA